MLGVSVVGSFILASGSPRRKDLLESAGQKFEIITADVDENIRGLSPEDTVKHLAVKKAKAVFDLHKKPTLGADTVVVFDDTVVGKPCSKEHAVDMLKMLSGKKHYVLTGVALVANDGVRVECVRTDVYMNDLSADFINAYVSSGRALDKAGAYGMQDGGFVQKINGSYTNVVGLPMELTEEILKEKGLWQEKK